MSSFFLPVSILGRPFFNKRVQREQKVVENENEIGVQKCELAPRSQSAMGMQELMTNKEFYGRVKSKSRQSFSTTHEFLKRGTKSFHVMQVEAPVCVQNLQVKVPERQRRLTNWDTFALEHNLNFDDTESPRDEFVLSPSWKYPSRAVTAMDIRAESDPLSFSEPSIAPWNDIIESAPNKTLPIPTKKKKKKRKKTQIVIQKVEGPIRKPKPPVIDIVVEEEEEPEEEKEHGKDIDEDEQYRNRMSRGRKKYRPSKVASIQCSFLKKKALVPVKLDSGFGDLDIQNVFNFTNHQFLYLHIKGIKEKKGDKRFFPFITDPELPYMTCLDRSYLHLLRDDMIYQVIVEDLREKQVADLTTFEILQIRERFDDIDADGSGEIDFADVKAYYDLQKARDLDKATNLSKIRTSLAKDQEEITYVTHALNSRKQQLDRYYNGKIEVTMAIDEMERGSISWDEFLLHESVEKIRERQSRKTLENYGF
jgi:hypothetical protein